MPTPHRLSPRALDCLACPRCRGAVDTTAWRCGSCGTEFPAAPSGAPDLRLRQPLRVRLDVEIGTPTPQLPRAALAPLERAAAPRVDFGGVEVPHHLTPELLSHFPAAGPGQMALDLGCGRGVHRAVCERAGFDYVGLDYGSAAADLLGDAHALPFRDACFDFVLSLAVFEHLRNPWLAAHEVARVMAPGALFLGTVAFLEPHHSQSYYHHSHLGTLSSLQAGGLEVLRVAPMVRWNVLAAQAENALFPGLPTPLARALVAPLQILHRAWWALLRRRHAELDSAYRLRRTTGAFAFLAIRPESSAPAPAEPAPRAAAGRAAEPAGSP